ncbi:MAG: DUF2399 domain-containing protein, partial [Clostridiales bacterium]|nr:DUF2399 domain-containing protein [Clostridiales bacterium]
NQFPCRTGMREYLAVFAGRLTGNPHAFDDGSRDGQLLTLTVLWENERQEEEKQKSGDQISSTVFPVIGKQKHYLAVGILKDDMSNYAMLSGIRARKKDGREHAGIEGFLSEGEPVQVPLSVIAGWEQVECPDNTIYIVENPSVYALLCQRWLGKRACMCMNGQPRLSAVLILDLLAKSNATVYYAGDFDPEGLLIAQKIRQYYLESLTKNISAYSLPDSSASGIKQKFQFWHMSGEDCHASLSEEPISEKRMKILDRITDQELAHAVRLLRKYGVAGYQENIYDRYQE